MPPTRAVRVPDAMQRFFSDASQSRDPSQVASWAPDQQRTACALRRIRGTSFNTRPMADMANEI